MQNSNCCKVKRTNERTNERTSERRNSSLREASITSVISNLSLLTNHSFSLSFIVFFWFKILLRNGKKCSEKCIQKVAIIFSWGEKNDWWEKRKKESPRRVTLFRSQWGLYFQKTTFRHLYIFYLSKSNCISKQSTCLLLFIWIIMNM